MGNIDLWLIEIIKQTLYFQVYPETDLRSFKKSLFPSRLSIMEENSFSGNNDIKNIVISIDCKNQSNKGWWQMWSVQGTSETSYAYQHSCSGWSSVQTKLFNYVQFSSQCSKHIIYMLVVIKTSSTKLQPCVNPAQKTFDLFRQQSWNLACKFIFQN